MAEAIVKNKRRILPCAAWLQGEFGQKDLFLGVPCLLGERGLVQVIDLGLNDEEMAMFRKSAASVRVDIQRMKSPG